MYNEETELYRIFTKNF